MTDWRCMVNIKKFLTGAESGPEFESARDNIIATLRRSNLFNDMEDVIEEMSVAEDADSFNMGLDEIYDFADADRIWLGP